MKLKEWKKFLDSIPDNKYTQNLNYTQFEDCRTVDVEDEDSLNCFVTLNGKQIAVSYADAGKGFTFSIKTGEIGKALLDKDGNIQFECLSGDVKIVKYKHKT
ncbi:MAG: hypothetical protein IMF19_01265 [Proteobacteria bacterium]|nr:hypothetical protein [Pseudomonadota bacterium]